MVHTVTRRPFRRFVLALALGAASMSAVIFSDVSPATADSGPHCTWDGRSACASFKSSGDKFFVCDRSQDTHSVAVRYKYMKNGVLRTGYAVNWWGPKRFNGCRTDVENHREGGGMVYEVCLADYAKPGGKRMKIIKSSCGGDASDRF